MTVIPVPEKLAARQRRVEAGAGDRDVLARRALVERRRAGRGHRRGGVDREDAGAGARPGVGVGDGHVACPGRRIARDRDVGGQRGRAVVGGRVDRDPGPEKLAASAAPLTKPVPVIVTFWLVAPWSRLLGLVEVTVGAALTVKTLAAAVLPSPLVRLNL